MAHREDSIVGLTVEGRYEVVRHIADGGMASVYLAHDLRLGRDVALKVLRPDYASRPDFAARFEDEARAAARLTHPNIVAVQDQGRDGALVFIAMELVRGVTLRTFLASSPPSAERVFTIADQLLAGLEAAHRRGLAHGDIKPENVLLDESGTVKITDFGLARAADGSGLRVDTVLGTASYLAPELVDGARPDARSDVYSAGLVLDELVTGKQVFPEETGADLDRLRTRAVPELGGRLESGPSGLSAESQDLLAALRPVLFEACAADPSARTPDAGQLRARVASARAELSPSDLAHLAPWGREASGGASRATAHSATEMLGAPTHTKVLIGRDEREGAAKPRMNRRYLLAGGGVLVALGALGLGVAIKGDNTRATVPQVRGASSDDATHTLDKAGFDVKVTGRSSNMGKGKVVDTSPAAGTELSTGSSVTVYVSTGPTSVAVPDVAGQSEAAARSKLESAGFAVGASQTVQSTQPAGTVVATAPTAGATATQGSTVALQISSGASTPQAGQVSVPSVVGMQAGSAQAVLGSFGLSAQLPTAGPSTTVTAQSPAAGTQVAPGTLITLQ